MGGAGADWRAFAGALALSFVFGSLHAFSVLVEPLRQQFSASRGSVALGYSLAIVCLMAGVFCFGRARRHLPAAFLALLAGTGAGGGLAAAAWGGSIWPFLAGYGVAFGFCNGIAYALFLEQAAAALPRAAGAAVGGATATYGAGAAVFAPLLGLAGNGWGPSTALAALAAAVAFAGLSASLCFAHVGRPQAQRCEDTAPANWPAGPLATVWAIYFLAAFGSLMVIAHAADLLRQAGAPERMSLFAPTAIACGTIAGSVGGGALADRLRPSGAVALPVLLLSVALAGLAAVPDAGFATALLGLCGVGYGALIAAVPALLLRQYGAAAFARTFGIVFTAWGVAGIAGPLTAAIVRDASGSYMGSIVLALGSAVAALLLSCKLAGACARRPPPIHGARCNGD